MVHFKNLVLLSALAAVYQNNEDSKQVISIISVGVALAYFCGILSSHIFLHFCRTEEFKKIARKKFSCHSRGESSWLLDDKGSMIKQLVEPTESEVCLRRESLICSQK